MNTSTFNKMLHYDVDIAVHLTLFIVKSYMDLMIKSFKRKILIAQYMYFTNQMTY